MTAERTRPGDVAHRAAQAVVIRGIAEVLGKVATFAWTILAARMLTQEEFGAVSYALTVMLLASAPAESGFDSGVVRRGSAEPRILERLYTEAVTWKTLLAVPVFLVAAGVSFSSGPSAEELVVIGIFLLAGFPEVWSHSGRAVSVARQAPYSTSTALVFQRIATAVAIAVAVIAGWGPIGVALGFLLGTVAGWVGHETAIRRLDVRPRLSLLRRDHFKEMWTRTWLIGVTAMVLMLLFRVDAVMLGALAGYEAVADYSVAYRLLETVLFVSFAVNQAILPVMSATTSVNRIRRGYERGLSVAAFVYLPFAVVCLIEGQRILDLAFGGRYAEASAPILAWLVPAPLLYAMAFFGSSVLIARDLIKGMLVAAVVATVANVGLNLWLIPLFSGTGAAAATTASYALQAAATLLILRRSVTRVNVVRPLVEAALASAVLAALLVVLDLPLLVELAVGGVLYLGVWFLIARHFAPEQLEVIGNMIGRRRQA